MENHLTEMYGPLNQTWVKQQWRNKERWSTIGAVDDMLLSLVLLLTTLFLLLFVCGWGKKDKTQCKNDFSSIAFWNESKRQCHSVYGDPVWANPLHRSCLNYTAHSYSTLPSVLIHCKMNLNADIKQVVINVHSVTYAVFDLLWFSQGINMHVWKS